MENKTKTQQLTLVAIFTALVITMTLIPFTGYITYSPAQLEITTLHIVTILAGVLLGWKQGAIVGGVWGITNLLRAATNPLWYDFLNPLISVVPRILVGLLAGLLFVAFKKIKIHPVVSASLTAAFCTVIHTLLVLSALMLFSGGPFSFYDMFAGVYNVIISLNGALELIAAILVIPALYKATAKFV